MKKINLTDDDFLKAKVKELAELSDAFIKVADDIIARDEYYTKKGFNDLISVRQDCFAVGKSIDAATSALLNIYNQSVNLPSNVKKQKEKKCQK